MGRGKKGRRRRVFVAVALALVVAVAAVALWRRWGGDRVTSTPVTVTTGTVAWVSDGDTLMVNLDGAQTYVRLLGIDAPEVAHGTDPADCGGDAAKQALQALTPAGTAVTITTDIYADPVDQYDRVLGYVATDTVPDIALALIEGGWVEAWVPASEPRPERFDAYLAAADVAKSAGQGSWPACPDMGR